MDISLKSKFNVGDKVAVRGTCDRLRNQEIRAIRYDEFSRNFEYMLVGWENLCREYELEGEDEE